MKRDEPTFRILPAHTGWPTGHAQRVVADAALRLAANPHGPLALPSRDGSLGRLVLPRRMAIGGVGAGQVYLLVGETVLRFNPTDKQFEALPHVGGPGGGARQFRWPKSIAVLGGDLYVADMGNRRVKVFDLHSLGLRYVLGVPGWRPVDVFARAGVVYILDARHNAVYRHRQGRDGLDRVMLDDAKLARQWRRIIVDRAGRIYLYDKHKQVLHVFDPQGAYLETVRDAGSVRSRFEPPPIVMAEDGRFALPSSFARDCAPGLPDPPPTLDVVLPQGKPIFNRRGERLQDVPTDGPNDAPIRYTRPYETRGTWFSSALDSEDHRCQWHRIQLEAELWPGTQLTLATYASDEERSPNDIVFLPDEAWAPCLSLRGEVQLPASGKPVSTETDGLVQSGAGQRLWLRVQLAGDGHYSPVVSAMRVHYPRDSYLNYLPAVFGANSGEGEQRFLEQFLSIVQTKWDALEDRVRALTDYVDPQCVPDDGIGLLAAWLAVPLEATWTPQQQRRLLAATPKLYARRGTREGLRDFLRIYLHAITGLSAKEQGEYPVLVEGFQQRPRVMLDGSLAVGEGQGAWLWGPAQVGRLQLGEYAREGEVALVSTNDPTRDVFHEYAHRFRVFVPAAWLRSDQDHQLLMRALEAEKPAHTQCELWLVQPRMQVGVQSTVGLDTIVSTNPVMVLASEQAVLNGSVMLSVTRQAEPK